MKRFLKSSLSIFLAITIIFSSVYIGLGEIDFSGLFVVEAKAASESDLTFTLNEDGESYSVTDCNTSASGEVVIPSTFNGLPVTSIGSNSFYRCTSLTSITIPDNVTSIGKYAFDSCTSLNAVNITNIATWCSIDFDGGYSNPLLYAKNLYLNGELIRELILPEGIAVISDMAFHSYTSLISVVIPSSVKSIGSGAFVNCSSLESIIISGGVTEIGDFAFWNCTSLTSITLLNSVTSIGALAFENCTNLTSITLPYGVTSIGASAFENCTNLTSITLPDSVTSIGASAFYDTGYYNDSGNWNGGLYIGRHFIEAKLTTIIKEGTKTIANGAFEGCTSLTSITLPDSVTSIGDSAFEGCTSLTSITLPDSVTSIGYNAFYRTGYYDKENNWENKALYIDKHLIELSSFSGKYEIKEGTKTIADGAFRNCDITSIGIPDSVTGIGAFAFRPDRTLKYVFYKGTKIQWDSIIFGEDNESLSLCKVYYECACYHIIGDWIIDKKATVNTAGSKHKECTECGEVLETAAIAQLKASKPKLKSIETTEHGVLIKWGKVSGADKYRVYRKTSKTDWRYIATTSNTYYTDKTAKSGTKYYYAVKSQNEAGNSSLSSSLSKYYLADPTLKTPSSTKSGVKLTWSKASGAEGYMVYRKTGAGSYSKIATVKGNSKITYTDKSARKGKKYTYKVKAYKSKTYSAYSNTKTITDKY